MVSNLVQGLKIQSEERLTFNILEAISGLLEFSRKRGYTLKEMFEQAGLLDKLDIVGKLPNYRYYDVVNAIMVKYFQEEEQMTNLPQSQFAI